MKISNLKKLNKIKKSHFVNISTNVDVFHHSTVMSFNLQVKKHI